MVDLLLVHPTSSAGSATEPSLGAPTFPMGLLYLAAVARRDGYSVAIHDATFATGQRGFEEALEREEPSVVGFGVYASTRAAALRMAAAAKAAGAYVLMGGPDASARPALYLTQRQGEGYVVDVVIVGESEAVIGEMLHVLLEQGGTAFSWHDRDNVAYRAVNGAVLINERCALVEDLDDLPPPARDLIDWEPYRRAWQEHAGRFIMPVIAARRCGYQCAWCERAARGETLRRRSPQSVVDEMGKVVADYRPDALRVIDEMMGSDRPWVRAWRDGNSAQGLTVPVECMSRVDLVDDELLAWLQEANCERLAFDVGSGSQAVLEAMRKGITVAQIRRAVGRCRELGVQTHLYLNVGHPAERWRDLKRSAALLRDTLPDVLTVGIAHPSSGMPFGQQPHQGATRRGRVSDARYGFADRVPSVWDERRGPFQRRAMRWLQREWEDARQRANGAPSRMARVRTLLALWLDRLLMALLARLSRTGAG